MHSPSVFKRVRVSGREGDYVVVRVDQPASVVDLLAIADPIFIERGVPFKLLDSCDIEPIPSAAYVHDSRVEDVRDLLNTSRALVLHSQVVLAEIHESVRATMQAIVLSQNLIVEADRAIGRARASGLANLRGHGTEHQELAGLVTDMS